MKTIRITYQAFRDGVTHEWTQIISNVTGYGTNPEERIIKVATADGKTQSIELGKVARIEEIENE